MKVVRQKGRPRHALIVQGRAELRVDRRGFALRLIGQRGEVLTTKADEIRDLRDVLNGALGEGPEGGA